MTNTANHTDQTTCCQHCDAQLTRSEVYSHECEGLKASRERGRATIAKIGRVFA